MEIELNFTNKELPSDWSLVIWGEDGAVSVRHNRGFKSDVLPFINKQEEKEPVNPNPKPTPGPTP